MINAAYISSNIPKIRFSGFTDQWEEKKLGDFLIPELREVSKPTGFYKAIGIRSHFKGTFQKIDSDPLKNVMDILFQVKENDFIVNITFAWEGALAIVKKEDDGGYVSHRFPTYIFDRNITFPEYFKYVFPTKRMKYLLEIISPGGAGRNRVLNKKNLLLLKINLPSITEQKRIADFLSAVDKWIENLLNQKDALEIYKKGMMQKIFSQEIRFKDESGENFSLWEDARLGHVVTVKMGQSPTSDAYNLEREGVPLIQGNADIKNRYTSPRIWTKIVTNRCEVGDIIMTVRAPAGYVAKSSHFACIGRGVCAIQPIEKFSVTEFIYQLLLQQEPRWKSIEQGSTFSAINGDDIRKLPIIIPSIDEQKKIAKFLMLIDSLITQKGDQITRVKEWKRGLMQQMFV